jgi:hypothetical protein
MLIAKDGLQGHHLAVCSHGVEENPDCIPHPCPTAEFIKSSKGSSRFDKNCQPVDSERHLTGEKS